MKQELVCGAVKAITDLRWGSERYWLWASEGGMLVLSTTMWRDRSNLLYNTPVTASNATPAVGPREMLYLEQYKNAAAVQYNVPLLLSAS